MANVGDKKKPDLDPGVQAAIEVVQFLDSMYAELRASERLARVGTYTVSAALEDRLAELEGGNGREGEIAEMTRLMKQAVEFVLKAKTLSPSIFDAKKPSVPDVPGAASMPAAATVPDIDTVAPRPPSAPSLDGFPEPPVNTELTIP
jgi:hypothetical protein